MNSQLDYYTATIANGETTSGAIAINGARVEAVHLSAAFTGTKIHFLTSHDGVTYQQVYTSAGALLEYTIAAGKTSIVSTAEIRANYIKIGSSGTEGAARTLGVTTWRG